MTTTHSGSDSAALRAAEDADAEEQLERRRKLAGQEAQLHLAWLNYDTGVTKLGSGNVRTVEVELPNGQVEEVTVDATAGPLAVDLEGDYMDFQRVAHDASDVRSKQNRFGMSWLQMTSTHQKIAIELVAKYNATLRESGRMANTSNQVNLNPYARALEARGPKKQAQDIALQKNIVSQKEMLENLETQVLANKKKNK
mmetsp:Transcript_77059/g.200411  ORF Transcript_77059/g.200411 Transcript_77059/m.200411 type:complete len:198 (+) Transcript_77059:132-725(+)|eukprot:CAMPEP_0115233680 /NCGR_PEP_ID=MMETSP0270-20121206/34402_1 /TAXON_ID=71861 /ORGANISM="Scrippsiella trochoidea, Strain CCMP3099" /LENGTH=197 /DNA_ID=CAMNT_0002648403 /DNA_START=133 /DNA_END=726 /DNA_ORIENTATION=+